MNNTKKKERRTSVRITSNNTSEIGIQGEKFIINDYCHHLCSNLMQFIVQFGPHSCRSIHSIARAKARLLALARPLPLYVCDCLGNKLCFCLDTFTLKWLSRAQRESRNPLLDFFLFFVLGDKMLLFNNELNKCHTFFYWTCG